MTRISTTKLKPKLAKAAAELLKALRRIEEPQGDRARRNARAAVLEVLRKLRGELDTEYPVARRKGRRKKRRTGARQRRDLRADGWIEVKAKHILAQLAEAGIRTKLVESTELYEPLTCTKIPFAPEWAVMIAAAQPTKLKLAKRSIRERKALMTEIWLERGGQ